MADVLNRTDMMPIGDPAARDFGRMRLLGDTLVFDAAFENFIFPPHFHETLMIGLIWRGRKIFRCGRVSHEVTAGGLSIVNPGDIHTGGVARSGEGLGYTALYPGADLLGDCGLDVAGDFASAVVDDRGVADLLASALRVDADAHLAEEMLIMALGALGRRHGSGRRQAADLPCAAAVSRATDYIRSSLDAPLRLDDIAAHAGVGGRHLIRSFQHGLGMTPQQYVRQERVRRAAELLRAGLAPAESAQAAGFSDQPHLTRTFRSVMGVTPAAYQRAVT